MEEKNRRNIANQIPELSTLGNLEFAAYIVNTQNYEVVAATQSSKIFSEDNPVGKKCNELFLNGSNEPCIDCDNRHISNPLMPFEFKNGDRIYQRFTRPIKWQGAKNFKLELIVDITEARKQERELNILRVYKEKVENLPHVPVIVFGRRGKITSLNSAAEQLLGYGQDDLEYLHIWSLLDDETKEKIYDLTVELTGGDRVTFESVIIGKNGKIEAHLDILCHRDIKGVFLEGIMFIIEKPKKIIRFY